MNPGAQADAEAWRRAVRVAGSIFIQLRRYAIRISCVFRERDGFVPMRRARATEARTYSAHLPAQRLRYPSRHTPKLPRRFFQPYATTCAERQQYRRQTTPHSTESSAIFENTQELLVWNPSSGTRFRLVKQRLLLGCPFDNRGLHRRSKHGIGFVRASERRCSSHVRSILDDDVASQEVGSSKSTSYFPHAGNWLAPTELPASTNGIPVSCTTPPSTSVTRNVYGPGPMPLSSTK